MAINFEEVGELVDSVVFINRVAKVVKGGRRFSFSAPVVVGDQKGYVGAGMGKANEVPPAVEKATKQAVRNFVNVPLVHARNGREALNLLRGEGEQAKIDKPSVVMLDINMPRMNGLELLEVLRSDPEFVNLNVFIMTTSDLESDRLKARQLARRQPSHLSD